jgi:flagellar basal body rod protein FlgB
MNLLSLVPDNLTEVLLKILQFTALRHKVLFQNLQDAEDADFRPQDMPAAELAAVLDRAVAEHLQSHRLVFRDTDNIRFGPNGSMEVRAVVDERAETLLRTDRRAYVLHQKHLCHENTLNHLVAEGLLELACGRRAGALRLQSGLTLAALDRVGPSPKHYENVD